MYQNKTKIINLLARWLFSESKDFHFLYSLILIDFLLSLFKEIVSKLESEGSK